MKDFYNACKYVARAYRNDTYDCDTINDAANIYATTEKEYNELYTELQEYFDVED